MCDQPADGLRLRSYPPLKAIRGDRFRHLWRERDQFLDCVNGISSHSEHMADSDDIDNIDISYIGYIGRTRRCTVAPGLTQTQELSNA